MIDNMVAAPLAGAPADTKDLHLEEVSILPINLTTLKPGYALMIDKDGLAKASDGSRFYGVRSESPRSVKLGNHDTAVSIGVRRKGVVYVATSGDVSKITKGSYLKIAQDGTFMVTTSVTEAVGIAMWQAEGGLIPLSFNTDFFKGLSSSNGITEEQVNTKLDNVKTEIKQTTDKLQQEVEANKAADFGLDKRVKALETKK